MTAKLPSGTLPRLARRGPNLAPARRLVPQAAAQGEHSGPADQSMTSERLAARIAEMEARLAQLFQPGQPQPRAAVVAGMRKEIATLRSQLQQGLGAGPNSAAGVASRSPAAVAMPGLPKPSAALMTSALGGAATAASSGRVLNALKLVEAQLSMSRQGDVSITQMSTTEQQELLQLQEENAALKERLDLLFTHQALLQSLAVEHGLPIPAASPGSSAPPTDSGVPEASSPVGQVPALEAPDGAVVFTFEPQTVPAGAR